MAGDASIQRYNNPTAKESQDTQGVAQFGRDGRSWNITMSGMTFQGGTIAAAGPVSFVGKYEKQVLGVFVSAGTISDVSATGFTASAAGYWWAIGV